MYRKDIFIDKILFIDCHPVIDQCNMNSANEKGSQYLIFLFENIDLYLNEILKVQDLYLLM